MRKPLNLGQYLLAPSILAGDHSNLSASVKEVEEVGTEWVHLDIMDGHFVPNLTFGPQTVAALRAKSELFFDVHLMLSRPDKYADAFIDAGADLVSIHVEPEYDIQATLKHIRSRGCYAGIVLNPDTAFEKLLPHLAEVDLVLQMTVFPGFGGQSFIEGTLKNIALLEKYRKEHGLAFRIEVDGGIDRSTVEKVKNAGADTFVSGSAFFKDQDRNSFMDLFLSK